MVSILKIWYFVDPSIHAKRYFKIIFYWSDAACVPSIVSSNKQSSGENGSELYLDWQDG